MLIFVALATLLATCTAWTVRNDTDWTANCPQNPYGKGKSAEDCADQCQKRQDCAAVSWNGPRSAAADSFCNFKCSTDGHRKKTGEEGVVVRLGKNFCKNPPPTPPRLQYTPTPFERHFAG